MAGLCFVSTYHCGIRSRKLAIGWKDLQVRPVPQDLPPLREPVSPQEARVREAAAGFVSAVFLHVQAQDIPQETSYLRPQCASIQNPSFVPNDQIHIIDNVLKNAIHGYRCQQCGKVFKHLSNFSTHRNWVCNKEPRFALRLLPLQSSPKSQLRSHLFRRHDVAWTSSMPLPSGVGMSPGLKFNQQFVPITQDASYNSVSDAQVSNAVSQGFLPSVPSTSIIP
ncbi:hypothetical protein GE061_003431 [Apolygus lucorum]|uniref:C2H2-type domain-containing protein n=1 Tax=Apolygus lucorum TaxID=248454 RepID=A0A8S9X3S7_APOLU|nr:hypothetical protein GE061_003431 [Apolygus lucorum]